MNNSFNPSALNFSEVKVKDLVLNNINLTSVLNNLKIDYCCNGDRTLQDVLNEKNISKKHFIEQLNSVINTKLSISEYDFVNMDIVNLSDYIINTHHNYIIKTIPVIKEHLSKILKKHASNHPYLSKLQTLFDSLSQELLIHMHKEEKILFPLIKYVYDCDKFSEKPKSSGYGSVLNPIRQMESEHSSAGNILSDIRSLTSNFTPPYDACTTFILTYSQLHDFEQDLFVHIHLENNILFPKAIQLEQKLISKIY